MADYSDWKYVPAAVRHRQGANDALKGLFDSVPIRVYIEAQPEDPAQWRFIVYAHMPWVEVMHSRWFYFGRDIGPHISELKQLGRAFEMLPEGRNWTDHALLEIAKVIA